MTNETAPSVDSIRTAAYNALHASGADASVTYIDLESGATFSLDGGNSRSSASVIKLLVLAALLDSVHAGTHTLDESLTVSNADMVGGTGVISDMGVGDYTLSSLATYMITDSDNVATNKIIGLLGMENINAEAAQLGLPNTRLERLMMDEAAIAAGKQNYISTDDAAKILQMVYDGALVDASSSAFALQLLEGQNINEGIIDGVPTGIVVAHKTGDLTDVENDAAIVEASQPYVLAVMATGAGNAGDLQAIAAISAAVWDARI